MTRVEAIATTTVLVVVAGPWLLGAFGTRRVRRPAADARRDAGTRWEWQLTTMSALLYTLAFNVTFFIQELFLVLPKACVPGLRPTLFHNDHGWEGANDVARLLQGTGALSTLLSAGACALLLRRARRSSTAVRLWLLWMVYCGVFLSLPQVVVGSMSAGSDLGMAMDGLDLGPTAKTVAAAAALGAIVLIAVRLTPALLGLADARHLADAKARSRWIFTIATLPTVVALPLIFAFRVPRAWIEVVLVPAVVSLIGVAWMQAGAWRTRAIVPTGDPATISIVKPLAAVLVLLLVFQLVLRPGIRFY